MCFSESLNFIAAFLRPYCYERRDYIWGSLDIISKVNNVTGINLLCLSFLFFLGLTKLGNIEEFFNQNFFKKTRKSEPKERSYPKGQLISKCLFWYLQFFQKTNKKIRRYYDGTSSRIIFVRFLEELKTKKRHFEIHWPLMFWKFGCRLGHELYFISIKLKCTIKWWTHVWYCWKGTNSNQPF